MHNRPFSVRRHLRRTSLAAICATLALAASGLVAAASSASAGTTRSAGCSTVASGPTRIGRISGLVRPMVVGSRCAAHRQTGAAPATEPPYDPQGDPPLLYHGGPMMSTRATNDQLVITPIYWEPSGNTFDTSYTSIITQYLDGAAHDSGKLTNVFSSLYQYSGSNGGINYKMQIGTPITDTDALPASGCTLANVDKTDIYADGSGYSSCIDDAQVITETNAVVSAHSLPVNLGHLYVLFLPKHVESCFLPGSTTTSNNECTLNHQPSAAFCAYHSQAGNGTVYANMPFPAYESGTGFSCTNENLDGNTSTIQSPNGNPDADVEVSPLSHETSEAVTDPDTRTGWYDDNFFENGDDCAYIYGTLSGAAGVHFNQVIDGHHYLTQEEFSNKDFVPNVSGCIQKLKAVKPAVSKLAPNHGPKAGGNHITITGKGFPGATTVHFGTKTATFAVQDSTHISVTVPKGKGIVDVTVTTSAGTSAKKKVDRYTYK
jgi:hypothetical protein